MPAGVRRAERPVHARLDGVAVFWIGTDRTTRLTPLSYYLAGNQVDYSQDYCASSQSDFTLVPVRVKGAALLTPANRVMFLYAVHALEEIPYRAALRALLSAAARARRFRRVCPRAGACLLSPDGMPPRGQAGMLLPPCRTRQRPWSAGPSPAARL